MKTLSLEKLVLVGLIAVLSGCGEGGPSVNHVEGLVTMNGQPIEGVTVNFSPVTAGGNSAVGTTDASGKFKLTTIPDGKANAGAPEGEYYVGLVKSIVSAGGGPTSTDDPNYGKEAPSTTEVVPTIKHEVPVKYNNPEKSGFKATVKSGSNSGDAFKFDLKGE